MDIIEKINKKLELYCDFENLKEVVNDDLWNQDYKKACVLLLNRLKIFDELKYLEKYDDVRISKVNPIEHYIYYGINEERDFVKNKFFKNMKKSNEIDFSICIPLYNDERNIVECIESAMNQKNVNLEIIILDDGSTDDSFNIANDLLKFDKRIRLFRQKNKGLSITRNNLIAQSKGKYIVFLDSDDLLVNNILEESLYTLNHYNLDKLIFTVKPFTNDERFIEDVKKKENYYRVKGSYPSNCINGKNALKLMLKNNDYRPVVYSSFYRRSFLLNNKIKFYPKILHEDNLFTFCSNLLCRRALIINNIYYKRRIRKNSIMTSNVTWLNVISLIISCLEMIKFIYINNLKNKFFFIPIRKVLNQSKAYYENLDENQKKQVLSILKRNKKLENIFLSFDDEIFNAKLDRAFFKIK